ncbi:MAG TPA: hypothetical protein VJ850_12750 [Candidatus Limnocylindrales bacterium]|nr:hypothetical protein [Candidatus Limnocylindrales bacterium]
MATSEAAFPQLTLQALIDIVGVDEFERESAIAHAKQRGERASLMVPHELSDRLWWEGSESPARRLEVAIELYLRIPSYGCLMYWRDETFDPPTMGAMWEAFRSFLDDPREAVADAAEYRLWVDYFEDPNTVEAAWREMTRGGPVRGRRFERLMQSSGPVPWKLKARVYAELADAGGWDEWLLGGLYGSCIDVYGQLERVPAVRLLARLRGVEDDLRYRQLAKALADPRLPVDGAQRRGYVVTRYPVASPTEPR